MRPMGFMFGWHRVQSLTKVNMSENLKNHTYPQYDQWVLCLDDIYVGAMTGLPW
jgi:hypothetical protein